MIYKCTPEKHRKLIVHVHKTSQRLKRQTKAKRAERMVGASTCISVDMSECTSWYCDDQ